MSINTAISKALLTAEERSAIAEIVATTNILRLGTRMTSMRFAGIAKFTETEWITCSVYDPDHIGIDAGDTLPIEITLSRGFHPAPVVL